MGGERKRTLSTFALLAFALARVVPEMGLEPTSPPVSVPARESHASNEEKHRESIEEVGRRAVRELTE